jgi:alpha-galactosidase
MEAAAMRIIAILWFGLLYPQLSLAAGHPAYVNASADQQGWTIGNDLVEREIRFDASGGLYTSRWVHKVTGADFMLRARDAKRWGPEFYFNVDGERLSGSWGTDFALAGSEVREITPAGRLLEIKLKARTKPVEVSVFYAVYDGHPVVRKWLAVTNRGQAVITLTHMSFESLRLQSGAPADLQVSGFYGSQPRELFYTGRVDDAAIVQRNSRTGEGFIAMNEAPGYLKRTEMWGWGEGLQAMYDTDLFPFERSVAPGETFTTAKSSVAFFADGRGFADPRWIMPTYTSRVLMKKGSASQPPWIYNTWEPFERNIDAAISKDLVAAASRMGLDIFTIDDGWQQDYGENNINTKMFPGGLDEIQASVERQGMRLGLWVPLAAVGVNTKVYQEHPEWLCRERDGKSKFTGTASGPQAVMCLASPYQEVAAKRISDLIGRYHLKYVKIDLTTVFNTYGESPGCNATGHYHRSWAESLTRIYEGIQNITDRIYRDHPDVLLDLTFELWGQKHVIDYGLLAAGDLDWLSNVDDQQPGFAGPRSARTLLYLRSLAIPVETMLIGNLHAESAPIEERLATAMGSAPLFLGDLRKLAPSERDWYHEKIQSFKELRRATPIGEGFFPLGNWQQPGASSWDGFARLSREGNGLVVLFKNETTLDFVEVQLPMLPAGRYSLDSIMTGSQLGEFEREKLQQGIRVGFPKGQKVEILSVKRR